MGETIRATAKLPDGHEITLTPTGRSNRISQGETVNLGLDTRDLHIVE